MKRTYPPAIFAIGRNYAEHAAEMGAIAPTRPVVFMKNPASVIGDGEPIRIPPICAEPVLDDGSPREQVDYEGELAVIIGRTCRDVPEKEALAVIEGYAVANDVSARWWQKKGSGGQFIRGKSFDTFCPMSEVIPAEVVGDPQSLTITTTVSGELMQRGHTSQMIFTVGHLVEELSRGTTLLAETVILTGTPPGVGAGRTPPRFLRHGDTVSITIERIGTLTNPVIVAADVDG
ncbi:MAG: fumarylacetoacetate hydrolase family protein [Phycisphaerales bacterium]|nr:fumarylacetoacetate hydrolase family protein [Phycisphaerales bacterium]